MKSKTHLLLLLPALLCATATTAQTREDPDTRAARIEAQMTDAERLSLLMGSMSFPFPGTKVQFPAGTPLSAGYVPGVPRLGVPAQLATDAGLGVTNPIQSRPGDVATAMPASLASQPRSTRAWPSASALSWHRRLVPKASMCCWPVA